MLSLNGLNISLDRREQGSDLDFISHAHSDHTYAARSSKHVLASEQTMQLIEQAYRTKVRSAQDNGGVELLESGHMLGSKQLYVTDAAAGSRITYTGDFQMEKSKTAQPIEVRETDCLIMDSTYSDPHISFDPKHETEAVLQDWVVRTLRNGIVLFSVYAMGKSQELIALLNEVGIEPAVSEKISRISKVYENNGVRLKYSSMHDNPDSFEELVRGDFAGVTEARDISGLALELEAAYNKSVFTAVATGWAGVFKFDTDIQFALSDHADFSQSTDYIERSNAKCVFTYGSDSERFAANLSRAGYNAMPFSSYGEAKRQALLNAIVTHK